MTVDEIYVRSWKYDVFSVGSFDLKVKRILSVGEIDSAESEGKAEILMRIYGEGGRLKSLEPILLKISYFEVELIDS